MGRSSEQGVGRGLNMAGIIDLSHVFEDGMPGFRMRNEDGTFTQYTARVRPLLTHEQSLPKYQGKACFEITEMAFQTSVGTYMDSPYHRYPDGRDIARIEIDEVVLPGLVVDVRGRRESESVGLDVLSGLGTASLKGKAVLFNFGWDKHWGCEEYYSYPHISGDVARHLLSAGVRLVGVDTINIDDSKDLARPVHTLLLKNEVLVVENLTGLERLHGKEFRFFAVPWKARKAASLPIRAFAEIL